MSSLKSAPARTVSEQGVMKTTLVTRNVTQFDEIILEDWPLSTKL
jgi:hypothetical protein